MRNRSKHLKREDTKRPSIIARKDELLECVKRLEEQNQHFAKYLAKKDLHKEPSQDILEHISLTISEIFNCPLEILEHKSLAIVAIHAFYCSDDLHASWIKCEYPMFAGLLVCFILRTMQSEFKGLNESGLVKKYRKSYIEFEDAVLEILEESYRMNEDKTLSTLKVKYNDLIKQKDGYTPACSVDYLIDLAMMAKCERILDHFACRRITNDRWTPKINISRNHFLAAFFTIIPILKIDFNCTAEEKRINSRTMYQKMKSTACWNLKKLKIFYTSPCSKFCIHTIAYFVYIILYGLVLLRSRQIDFRYLEIEDRIPEMVLTVWQISFLLEFINSSRVVGSRKFLVSNPADGAHNTFNIIWMVSMICSLPFVELVRLKPSSYTIAWAWGFFVILSKLFYIISFIFSSIRIMRIFAADSFFGSIVVMMNKMLWTLWSFLVLIILFWGTYSIAVVSLLEVAAANQTLALETNQTLLWNIFSNGAFEIFGELQDDVREGKIKDCPEIFNSTDIRDVAIDCAFRTWMVPILLFIYVLVSSVLLVNLVTSFFTNTYEEVRDSSMLHFRYKHYQRLFEFERKFFFPHPLAFPYYFIVLLKSIIKYYAEAIVCGCCGKYYSYCNQGEEEFDSSISEAIPLVDKSSKSDKKSDTTVIEVEKQKRREPTPSEEYSLPVLVEFIQKSTRNTREKKKKAESYDKIGELMGRIIEILKYGEENAVLHGQNRGRTQSCRSANFQRKSSLTISRRNTRIRPKARPSLGRAKEIRLLRSGEQDKAAYLFENQGSDCFANAAVNVLLSLTPLIEELRKLPPGTNQVADLLVEAASRTTASRDVPRGLRALFPAFTDGQHDPAEYLSELIEALNIEREDGAKISDDFRMTIKYQAECVSGCRKVLNASFQEVVLSVPHMVGQSSTIEDLVRARLIENFESNQGDHSAECSVRKVKSMKEYLIGMPRFFILTPEMVAFDGQVRQFFDIPLEGVIAEETLIYGKKYRMRGAIRYFSNDGGQTGHCVSWRNMHPGWSVANDTNYETTQRALPDSVIGFRVLAFEAV